jgi:predicted transcriptional regulator
MTNEKNRKERINSMYITILKATKEGKQVCKDKLIAVMGVETGISRRMAMEYVKTLVNAGMVKEEDGVLNATKT